MRLLLFNPETEYALASGASFYTPPARVEKMRKECQLLPEAWADADDIILVDNPGSLNSEFRLAAWNELGELFRRYPDLKVEPWGWNPALVRRLIDHGVPADRLPDGMTMDLIRRLAHRRTTIVLNSLWNERVQDGWRVTVPTELTSIDECMDFYRSNHGCWMKAPWSSSGRGVINTSADMTEIHVDQWCRGIIRRQGSVIGETGADRVADFATEWRILSGDAIFLGLSSFSTSNRGKYISNDNIDQREMKTRFNSMSSVKIQDIVAIQREILKRTLAGYDGLCGIDMLIESSGKPRPFVELNLRRTMGMLHISNRD
ncbi:MAG: hypothetical protein K2L11_04030 [Muribaculaceae bacterium]|nr:hypothetical protein [Muribaculaceae bacterium]